MLKLKSNPDPIDFFQKIKEIQVELYRPGIESKFTPNEIEKFREYRRKWRNYVETVQINIATVLLDRLKQNETAFETGIEDINREIQEINDTVSFLNLVERTIGTLGRIVTLPM